MPSPQRGQAPGSAPFVLVVGSVSCDHTIFVEKLPGPGETVSGHGYQTVPGGKGLNQAVAAARQGACVDMACCVGGDEWGQQLLGVLQEEGIGAKCARTVPGQRSGVALITVDGRGSNTIVVAPGANGQLSPEDVEAAAGVLGPGCVVLAQLEVPLDAVQAAFSLARAKGATTVLNPSPVPRALSAELLCLADVVVPNQAEAAAISGRASPEEALAWLQDTLGASVALTLGERGALVAGTDARGVLVPTFEVKAVDTTAAGDAFCGALVAALVGGSSLSEAARRGCAAGALATTVRGAVPSLPSAAAVDLLLAGGP